MNAETLIVYPLSVADRIEKVSKVDRSRKPADHFDKAGRDSFAEYLANAQVSKQKKAQETVKERTDNHFYGRLQYYNRHAMTAYFAMEASETDFTC